MQKTSYNKRNKQGHLTHECRENNVKVTNTWRFNDYFFNCQKFGHKAYECRSKSKWALNQSNNAPKQGNTHY